VRERLEREVAHELGHTFGLVHCPDARCCMSLSTTIEQVDAKLPEFCRDCRERLRERQAQERLLAGPPAAPDPQEVQP
jgi:archaemetzincin